MENERFQEKPPAQPVIVIKVGGYIEFTTSDELDRLIDSITASNSYNIIIDLERVDYVSSRGWSIFLSKIKEIRENGGDLKLVRMTPNVYEVYKVLEFFWFLKVYDSIEDAVHDFDHGISPMPE